MQTAVLELSKYAIITFFVLFTLTGFIAIGRSKSKLFYVQRCCMFAVHALAFLTFFVYTGDMKYLVFYVIQLVFFVVLIVLYSFLYPKVSKLIVNNMCMLLAIGFVMISRITFAKAVKQFIIVIASCVISLFIPFFIKKLKFLSKMVWLYAVAGVGFLAVMKVVGTITYGANITFTVAGITIQPVEFVKIIFVFFLASFLSKRHDFKAIVVVSLVSALHVLLLVWAKELGGALIFCMVYLCLIYVATRQPLYFLGGAVGGGAAAFVAYHLFSHVRVRVQTWTTPFSVIRNDTSQISQGLFAIGTGGWFGLGLMEGIPHTIPVSSEDMVFAAVTEELGLLFSLCMILVCLSTFIMFINIATRIHDPFYKLLATGFGVQYIFQVFLTIGGGTKFIPLTGVTLPLVSYGGSSVLCSLVVFHVIQGIYVLRQTEGNEEYEEPEDYDGYDEDEYADGAYDDEYYADEAYDDEYYGNGEYEEDGNYEDGEYDGDMYYGGGEYDEDEYYEDGEYEDDQGRDAYENSRRRRGAREYERLQRTREVGDSFDEYAVTQDELQLDIPDEYFDE